MEFIKTLEKITSGGQFDLSECLEFIREVVKTYNPTAPYREDYTMIALQNGFSNDILNACINAISQNPELFKVQMYKVISSKGQLLKTYYKQI